jgi:hypothetical protein
VTMTFAARRTDAGERRNRVIRRSINRGRGGSGGRGGGTGRR